MLHCEVESPELIYPFKRKLLQRVFAHCGRGTDFINEKHLSPNFINWRKFHILISKSDADNAE